MPDVINQMQFVPLLDDSNTRLVGFQLNYLSFSFRLFLDPAAKYILEPNDYTHRPTYTGILTWPPSNNLTEGVVLAGF
jgi:hypothetical protein